ncbi:TPA: hypothetical protein N0F65_011382 [Lagenidium giganteum]|uniref:Acylamino-acid-releasing enzyme n=2 Tax=Lagenidium giganteum TaxID=4803 RepID=A0AAV2Z5H9_9STRA|nr:TPA: hypothetical protein N0F65_011382 [Lagenidium giganteum]
MAVAAQARAERARLSELYARVNAASQTLHGGFLSLDAAQRSARVQLIWGQKDLVHNASLKFHTQAHVAHAMADPGADTKAVVQRGIFPSNWEVAVTSVSPSGKYVATVRLEKGSDASAPAEGVFCVFHESRLVTTFRAPKSIHGAIYTGEREGGLAWSHDETKVAYVAEKKKAESKAFWENVNDVKKDATKADAEPATLPGNQFEQDDDWGEQYVGKKTGAIFVATIATGKIEEVKGVAENLTCADVCFTPNDHGLVFAATETDKPRRLGLIYCYNRPIALYHVEFNAEDASKNVLTKLAIDAEDAAAALVASCRSPRFSPDGKYVAFLATRDVATHNTCSLLCVMDWATKKTKTLIDVVDEPPAGYTTTVATTAFTGLYCGSLSRKCWSDDGSFLFFSTQMGTRVVWKYVNVSTKEIVSPTYIEGSGIASETILDRDGNHFLLNVTSPVRPASVYLIEMNLAAGTHARPPVLIEDQSKAETHIKDWKLFAIPTKVSDEPAKTKPAPPTPAALKDHLVEQVSSEAAFEATLLVPKTAAPAEGYPVLLDVHGGPHGNSPASYRMPYDYFAALGFAVVSVNYRGSVGYGLKPLESLVGKVGTQDIYDCHYALQYVLEHANVPLNRANVHCSGGSHGGWIGAHLVGQFPTFYKSCTLRNPVTNISSVFFTSDIPDWGLGVSGIKRFDSVITKQGLANQQLPPVTPTARAAIMARTWEISPMANDLSQVQTPVLLGIGGKDLRVPPNQGLQFRDALRALGRKVKMLWYPDDCHPIDSVQASSDFAVNWALWLLEH